jgi:D-3-phosphoglycerate dehydrogenase
MPEARYKVVYPDHRDPEFDIELPVYAEAGVAIESLGLRYTPDPEKLLRAVADADAIVTSTVLVDRPVVSASPRLKIAVRLGVGYEQLDLDALAEHGAFGCNVPDYGSEEVSLHALSLALALRRQLFQLDREVRAGGWRYMPEGRLVHRLSGQTVGVVGLGRIGSAFVARARALFGRIIACDPYVPAERFASLGVEPVTLDELLRQSDVITLHVPLTQETTHLIGERQLALMKPSAVLVTTCRGKVVDQMALARALDGGVIEGAACDVFEQEPVAADHPLLRCRNVICSPHAAYYSEEARRDMRQRAAEEVVRVLRGEAPHYPLNTPMASAAVPR